MAGGVTEDEEAIADKETPEDKEDIEDEEVESNYSMFHTTLVLQTPARAVHILPSPHEIKVKAPPGLQPKDLSSSPNKIG